ncbi:hypothetical protein BPA_0034500 (plasmid) [Borrelia parkeri SLO]|uniref:Uncharacterized protein n=1 Tax=Borrelia parkeri SLO TaxID=1313294 RepID=W5ST43_BORPR|nr:hypothetical protein BPA_0034500 [Borrelia parkeri SLO]
MPFLATSVCNFSLTDVIVFAISVKYFPTSLFLVSALMPKIPVTMSEKEVKTSKNPLPKLAIEVKNVVLGSSTLALPLPQLSSKNKVINNALKVILFIITCLLINQGGKI